jgi:hypothetical protein
MVGSLELTELFPASSFFSFLVDILKEVTSVVELQFDHQVSKTPIETS